MLNLKGMRFPINVILNSIRWYAAYPLNYRHLEEMMEEGACRSTIQPLTEWRSASCR
jgi:putative transposase